MTPPPGRKANSMKFVVDLWLDGYDNDADLQKACLEFIKENLDFSASSVKAEPYNDADNAALRQMLKLIVYKNSFCPMCTRSLPDHAPDCPVARLLKEAP